MFYSRVSKDSIPRAPSYTAKPCDVKREGMAGCAVGPLHAANTPEATLSPYTLVQACNRC